MPHSCHYGVTFEQIRWTGDDLTYALNWSFVFGRWSPDCPDRFAKVRVAGSNPIVRSTCRSERPTGVATGCTRPALASVVPQQGG